MLLGEILMAGGAPQDFNGYGWVVANFDGVQGTAHATDFSTFTQIFTMQPDLGSTFFERPATAGVPVFPPPPPEPEGELDP